jgi:hypothetical protein
MIIACWLVTLPGIAFLVLLAAWAAHSVKDGATRSLLIVGLLLPAVWLLCWYFRAGSSGPAMIVLIGAGFSLLAAGGAALDARHNRLGGNAASTAPLPF